MGPTRTVPRNLNRNLSLNRFGHSASRIKIKIKIKNKIEIKKTTDTSNSAVPGRCLRSGTLLLIWFCTAWLATVSAWAQLGVTKGYKADLYDPQTGQIKGHINGAEARPILKTGQLQLINTTATYLNDKGEVALIIEAPEIVKTLRETRRRKPAEPGLRIRAHGK